jgi:subtilisin family serine protease
MNQASMWRRWWLLATIFVFLVFGQVIAGLGQPVAAETVETMGETYAPGEILIGLKPNIVQASALLTTMDAEVVDALPSCGVVDSGIGYRLRVPDGREGEAIAELKNDPAVLFAEPNWFVYAADIDETTAVSQPETPFLVSDPSYVERQWYLQRIGASRAWGLAYGADGFQGQLTTIQVAVVDSGIDVDHPEFEGMLLPGKNYVTTGAAPIDKYGHGTHVAGLIGAMMNNEIGIAGVAPKIKIDPRKVLNDAGSGMIDNVVRGICDAADAGANLINLSLVTSQRSSVLEAAVQYAAAKGVLLVAAAGNSGLQSVAYPAAFDEVMAVAATTYSDVRASYSNYSATAPIIEIAAPGGALPQSMYSTWAKGAYCRDTHAQLAESGYCTAEGTSMAAAIVTGAAALVWSINSELSADEVRALLRESAAPIAGSVNEIGSGRLDAQAAVRKLVNSDVNLSNRTLLYQANPSGPPFSTTVRLDNPSGTVIDWETGLIGQPDWVHLVGANSNGVVSGQASYGKPSHLTLVMEPGSQAASSSSVTMQVVGTRSDTTQVIRQLAIDLVIGTLTPRNYLPLVVQNSSGTIPPPPSGWEVPLHPDDRTGVTLVDESEAQVTLPFTFTLQRLSYTEVLVDANGFISFGSTPSGNSSQNKCLPNQDGAGAAIYGWWADLDPNLPGAHVSSFQPAADRFVVEFDRVPAAVKSGLDYTVSFQIVLYRNGDIKLNYGVLPAVQYNPPPVTVGVEARDGLFYNQISCKDDTSELGFLPASHQSFYLKGKESVH